MCVSSAGSGPAQPHDARVRARDLPDDDDDGGGGENPLLTKPGYY